MSGQTPTVALAIVDELREQILSRCQDGDYLGSEDQLVAVYNVSRPTFRQAVRVLQAEGLIRIRRGNSGGFFASTPSTQVVTRSASALLRREGSSLAHLVDASRLIAPEVVELAATTASQEARRDFTAFVADAWRDGDRVALPEAVEIAVEVGRRLGKLSGNPALALFAAVLSELVTASNRELGSQLSPADSAGLVAALREGHEALARGVGTGDGAAARRAMLGLISFARTTEAALSHDADTTGNPAGAPAADVAGSAHPPGN